MYRIMEVLKVSNLGIILWSGKLNGSKMDQEENNKFLSRK